MKYAQTGEGRMAEVVRRVFAEREDLQEVTSLEEADVIIDFSNPVCLPQILEAKKPTVIATTGFSEEEKGQIEGLAGEVPVVFAANFSLGVTVMRRVLRMITPVLEDDFDMEIVERHHNQKLDAPSGTALMLAEAMDPKKEYEWVMGRSGLGKRAKEIGIQAVRAGNIAGEHTVIYAGEDEILEVTHKAGSRRIFAAGALKAADFLMEEGRQPGLYDMDSVLFGEE